MKARFLLPFLALAAVLAVPASAAGPFSGYTFTYCPNCPLIHPGTTAVAQAQNLGMTMNGAQGAYASVTGPDGKLVVGGQRDTADLRNWMKQASEGKIKPAEPAKPPEEKPAEMCVVVTPGQSPNYGNMWGEAGVFKYKDPTHVPTLICPIGKYDAYGNCGLKGEESKINFDLRIGGKQSGGDEGNYGAPGKQVYPSTVEAVYGYGYLDKDALAKGGVYANERYFTVKESGPQQKKPNEDLAMEQASAQDSKATKTAIKPDKARAEEFMKRLKEDPKKAGYKPDKSDKAIRPNAYIKTRSYNSADAVNDTVQDVKVENDCSFRDTSSQEQQGDCFDQGGCDGQGGGFGESDGGGSQGGSGGGQGGDFMSKILPALMAALQGMNMMQQNQQPTPNPEASSTPVAQCPSTIDEVCGVDGATYANACVAETQNNVEIAYAGKCGENRADEASELFEATATLLTNTLTSSLPASVLNELLRSIGNLFANFLAAASR